MRFVYAGSTFAAVMALSIAGSAQQPNQPQSQTAAPPAAQQKSQSADQQVTIVGCVQSEADYRRARDAGKGGVAGTGIGVGNEFVLVNASMASGASSGASGGGAATGATGSAAGTATGTAGIASGSAYELTGSGEGQLASHVGKRVEIMGKLKAAEIGAAGPTGGPTAGAPPRGVDVASDDLKLRELEVTSVKEAAGACPASSPAAK